MESLTPEYLQGHDIEESVYRADPAWAASDLKYGIDNGLEALQIRKFGKDIPPRIATPAMKFGSMIHKFVLEPTEFPDCYALLDDKRTKKGKETALALQEGGIQTFTTPEMDQMLGMHNALSKNDFAKKYVLDNTSGKAEQSFWWTHKATGLSCKCRSDYVVDDMVIDLKTCGEGGASPDKFTKAIVNFKYHLAAAHYLQGTGAKRFIFIAVEKVFPYSVGIYQLSPHFIEKGYELQEQTLQEILEATTSKFWRGYTNACPNGIQTLTPPKWI